VTEPSLLRRALRDASAPPLRLLPGTAADLLEQLQAPPRLAAHLRLVHDVACQIAGWAEGRYPALGYDRDAMLFGAATHDIGKTIHVAELSAPGSEHEEAGRQLLLAHGISPELARFAATHASWTGPGITVEDLMVSVADKAWKNKRVPELEDLLVARLAQASGRDAWEEFLALDGLLETIGDDADDRLAFQASFPTHPDQPPNDPGHPDLARP
jgi:HD domain-containing protein